MTSAATWGSPLARMGTGAPSTLFLSRLPRRTRRTRLPRLRHRDPGHLGTLLAMRTGTAGRHLGDPAVLDQLSREATRHRDPQLTWFTWIRRRGTRRPWRTASRSAAPG